MRPIGLGSKNRQNKHEGAFRRDGYNISSKSRKKIVLMGWGSSKCGEGIQISGPGLECVIYSNVYLIIQSGSFWLKSDYFKMDIFCTYFGNLLINVYNNSEFSYS